MSHLRFEWDPDKAASNVRKHAVSFDEAATTFSDEGGLVIDDPDHSDEENPFILLGQSAKLRLLVVIHCYREPDEVIRLISARKASRTESRQYTTR